MKQFISSLLKSSLPDNFYVDVLEKKPLKGGVEITSNLTIDLLIKESLSAELESSGNSIRFIRRGREIKKSEVRQLIDYPRVTPEKFSQWLFSEGNISLAVQALETRIPEFQLWVDELGEALDSRIESTVFLSPPKSKSTPIHYDTSDVFAMQLSGCKLWRIYKPTNTLPSPKSQGQTFSSDKSLSYFGSFLLEPGDFLYLPRGWIHKVNNPGREPSIHISLSAFFTSKRSLFKNLLLEAYASISSDPTLLHRVTKSESVKNGMRANFTDLFSSLEENFHKLLERDMSPHFDYCLNGSNQRTARIYAQSSFSQLKGESILYRSRTEFITNIVNGKFSVSIDSTNFFSVSRNLFNFTIASEYFSISDLENSVNWSADEAARFLEVGVHILGLWFVNSN